MTSAMVSSMICLTASSSVGSRVAGAWVVLTGLCEQREKHGNAASGCVFLVQTSKFFSIGTGAGRWVEFWSTNIMINTNVFSTMRGSARVAYGFHRARFGVAYLHSSGSVVNVYISVFVYISWVKISRTASLVFVFVLCWEIQSVASLIIRWSRTLTHSRRVEASTVRDLSLFLPFLVSLADVQVRSVICDLGAGNNINAEVD